MSKKPVVNQIVFPQTNVKKTSEKGKASGQ